MLSDPLPPTIQSLPGPPGTSHQVLVASEGAVFVAAKDYIFARTAYQGVFAVVKLLSYLG
jgi:hypothetical protein